MKLIITLLLLNISVFADDINDPDKIINEPVALTTKEAALNKINESLPENYEMSMIDEDNCLVSVNYKAEESFTSWEFNFLDLNFEKFEDEVEMRCLMFKKCMDTYTEELVDERTTVTFAHSWMFSFYNIGSERSENLMQSLTELAGACTPIDEQAEVKPVTTFTRGRGRSL